MRGGVIFITLYSSVLYNALCVRVRACVVDVCRCVLGVYDVLFSVNQSVHGAGGRWKNRR